MTLPEGFVRREIIHVWYPTLDDLIKEKFGRTYSTPAALESMNDVCYLQNVDEDYTWADSEEQIVRWMTTGQSFSEIAGSVPTPWDLMTRLIRDGVLEAGEYLIEVMW
jgi:hypothetical protein